MDDFGIGYVGRDHPDHLMSALKMYDKKITTYWQGKLYCSITIKWDYKKMIFRNINAWIHKIILAKIRS